MNDLDERIAAALERVGQALRVQLWDAAKRHGLTPTQVQVLVGLGGERPDLHRVGALAAEFDVTHPTISDALAALRRKGLVAAAGRRDPLTLTPRGRDVTRELTGWDERTRAQLTALPAADKEATLRTLLELVAGLQRAGVITVARMCTSCRHFRRQARPGSAKPHYCALLETPLADAELRVDCPEHELDAA